MSVSFRIDEERGLVLAVCAGVFDVEDAQVEVQAFWKLPGREGRPVIWDLRDAEVDMQAEAPRELAHFVLENQPDPPPPRVAFVAPDDLVFGMSRMFEAYREDPATEFKVFRDLEEALQWAQRD